MWYYWLNCGVNLAVNKMVDTTAPFIGGRCTVFLGDKPLVQSKWEHDDVNSKQVSDRGVRWGGRKCSFLFLTVFVSLLACASVCVCVFSQLPIFISNLSPPSQLQYDISKHTATIRYPSRTQRMCNLCTGDMSEVRAWGGGRCPPTLVWIGDVFAPTPPTPEYLCSVKRRWHGVINLQ